MPGGWGRLTWHHSIYFLRFFSYSDKFTRFCQWKNVELNIHVSGLGGCGAWGPGLVQGQAGQGVCQPPVWWLWVQRQVPHGGGSGR